MENLAQLVPAETTGTQIRTKFDTQGVKKMREKMPKTNSMLATRFCVPPELTLLAKNGAKLWRIANSETERERERDEGGRRGQVHSEEGTVSPAFAIIPKNAFSAFRLS